MEQWGTFYHPHSPCQSWRFLVYNYIDNNSVVIIYYVSLVLQYSKRQKCILKKLKNHQKISTQITHDDNIFKVTNSNKKVCLKRTYCFTLSLQVYAAVGYMAHRGLIPSTSQYNPYTAPQTCVACVVGTDSEVACVEKRFPCYETAYSSSTLPTTQGQVI